MLTTPQFTADQQALHRISSSWPVIEPTRAKSVLGEEPAVIPGYPVQALRSNPDATSEILVEQLVDSGVIMLFERRSDAQTAGVRQLRPAPATAEMQKTSERLARYVRSLRVEIAGPLSADSLSALLGLIR